jgi:hypothetical protein
MSLARRTARPLYAAAGIVAALALAAGAHPATAPPVLKLDQLSVANGAVSLSGTVGAPAGASLSVNGRPLALDGSGHFSGLVDLNGASAVDVAVANPAAGQNVAFEIPLTGLLLGPGGLVPGNVLDTVEQAGATLLQPVGGFQAVGGQPLTIGGSVLDSGRLAGLTVNGTDVLKLLQPDQSFNIQVPGTTKEVTLKATDTSGVSETKSYSVSSLLGATGALSSVSAANAVGLRIAQVRYYVKGAAQTKRLRMVITVKDGRGYLVSGATILVRAKAAGRLTRRAQTKRSGVRGQAAFVLGLRRLSLGKRLVMITVARTPTAKAQQVSSVRLPSARRTAKKHH